MFQLDGKAKRRVIYGRLFSLFFTVSGAALFVSCLAFKVGLTSKPNFLMKLFGLTSDAQSIAATGVILLSGVACLAISSFWLRHFYSDSEN
jgi:hypothetical protein